MHFARRALVALLLLRQSIAQPSPRLPAECNKCKKLAKEWDLSCSSQKSVCECCRDIFHGLMQTACKGFRKLNSAPDEEYCIGNVHVAMEHRGQACDTPYDYERPLRGITPLRYSDMCNGKTDTCGSSMCSDSGCNTELERVEGRYRVIAHYREVYDVHPCEVAETRQLQDEKELQAQRMARKALRNRGAKKDTIDKEAAGLRRTRLTEKAAAAYAALEQAKAEKAAAEIKLTQKEADEKAAAIKLASAKAALEYAEKEKLLAQKVFNQKEAAVEEATRQHAAAQAALTGVPTALAAHDTSG